MLASSTGLGPPALTQPLFAGSFDALLRASSIRKMTFQQKS
jgi:hypothetical protein